MMSISIQKEILFLIVSMLFIIRCLLMVGCSFMKKIILTCLAIMLLAVGFWLFRSSHATQEENVISESQAFLQQKDYQKKKKKKSSQKPSYQHQQETVVGDWAIEQAFRAKARDVSVEGEGKVRAVLADDNKGTRHQRFVLELNNGLTLLFAHNIDLAPRLPNLQKGDYVRFRGDYIYNAEGGIIHWTHHDPKGRHIGGYLEYQNQRYE